MSYCRVVERWAYGPEMTGGSAGVGEIYMRWFHKNNH